jgi:hypothetical protein
MPSLAALLKTRNDRWQVTVQHMTRLMAAPRAGQDVGVAGAMKSGH